MNQENQNTEDCIENAATSPAENDTIEPAVERDRELEAARAEAAEWRDKFVRKMAEFDNFRKRTRAEIESQRQFITELLIAELLPVLDDFDRMLAAHAGESDPVVKGVELIRGKLWGFFQAHAVERIECRGKPFDPELHEAIITRETPGFPSGTVLEEITSGYRMGDRVIRHAQVVVSADSEETLNVPPDESGSPPVDSTQ